ncbi:MAG: hypothetical protein IH851_09010 [Armatimonadetes bacterium]|nr:hypothetical protein [Armatimonadota bacterium]
MQEEIAREEAGRIEFIVPTVTDEDALVLKRKSKILQLLQESLDTGLYRGALITTVAHVEAFLESYLRIMITSFPQRLKIGMRGGEGEPHISLDDVLNASDLSCLMQELVERRIRAAMYERPIRYLEYVERILEIHIPNDLKWQYSEVKASRDVVVHSAGVANSLYVEKAGELARAQPGETLLLDEDYFREAILRMKRLIVKTYSRALKKYGDVQLLHGRGRRPR